MVRFSTYFLLGVASLCLVACGPPRVSFDVQPDAGPGPADVMDVATDVQNTDVGMDSDAREGGADARTDARDAMTCDPTICDSACLTAGFPGGACRAAGCTCIGAEEDAGPRRDAGDDAIEDAGVRGCMDNSMCPPSTFCNGAGCMTRGFCSPRSDPSSCEDTSAPVCGCDGMEYMNTCARLVAGVRLDPSGACLRRD